MIFSLKCLIIIIIKTTKSLLNGIYTEVVRWIALGVIAIECISESYKKKLL